MNLCTKYARALAAAFVACSFACAYAQGPDTKQAPPKKAASAREQRDAEKLYLAGAKALEQDDLKTAEEDFEHATLLVPGNEQYQAAYEIARQHRATALVEAADKARLLGHTDEARGDLIQAFHLDPTNPMVAQHMDEIARDAAPDREPRNPEAEAGGLIELAPAQARRSFHLRTSSSEVLRQVLTAYGITPTLDSSIKSETVRFDADDVDFNDAARMVKLVTNTFFVPLDPSRVLVAQDTKDNRTKFERLALETVYFPGLTSAEITDMSNVARNLFDAQQATISQGNSTLTVRAPAEKLAALNSTLAEMLDGRSEIQLDVRLYSVAKTRTLNVGVQLPQSWTIFNVPSTVNGIIANNQSLVQQIISSGLASAGDYAAIAAILVSSGAVNGSVLGQPFGTFGGGLTLTGVSVSGVTGNLALNASDSRSIDHITVSALDQEEDDSQRHALPNCHIHLFEPRGELAGGRRPLFGGRLERAGGPGHRLFCALQQPDHSAGAVSGPRTNPEGDTARPERPGCSA
jgi:general secretion pathway protein D